jgi:hypothetical protein
VCKRCPFPVAGVESQFVVDRNGQISRMKTHGGVVSIMDLLSVHICDTIANMHRKESCCAGELYSQEPGTGPGASGP